MTLARRSVATQALLVALLVVAGCAWLRPTRPLEEKVETIAVLPLERVEPGEGKEEVVPPGAEQIVTAQIYGVLAETPRWRFVPDQAVQQALPQIPTGLGRAERARALGRAVQADAVLYGEVERFVERKGGAYGASRPASVAFTLRLVSVASGKELWQARFAETQKPLTSNLLNFWMFRRGGARWFSAAELARLGVERMLDDLKRRLAD